MSEVLDMLRGDKTLEEALTEGGHNMRDVKMRTNFRSYNTRTEGKMRATEMYPVIKKRRFGFFSDSD